MKGKGERDRVAVLQEEKGKAEVMQPTLSASSYLKKNMRTYYVYILSSKTRVLYIGVTNNLHRRIKEHKSKTHPGFTARHNVTRLVYFETFAYINNAIAREKKLKSWRRAKKIALVESVNASWVDLGASFTR